MNDTTSQQGRAGWIVTVEPSASLDEVADRLELAGIRVLNRMDIIRILVVESIGVDKDGIEAIEGVRAVEPNRIVTLDLP